MQLILISPIICRKAYSVFNFEGSLLTFLYVTKYFSGLNQTTDDSQTNDSGFRSMHKYAAKQEHYAFTDTTNDKILR